MIRVAGRHRAHRSFGYRFGQLCGYLILLAVPVLLMAAGSGIALLVRAAAGVLRQPGLEFVPVLRRGDRPGRGGSSQAILAVQRRRRYRGPGSPSWGRSRWTRKIRIPLPSRSCAAPKPEP